MTPQGPSSNTDVQRTYPSMGSGHLSVSPVPLISSGCRVCVCAGVGAQMWMWMWMSPSVCLWACDSSQVAVHLCPGWHTSAQVAFPVSGCGSAILHPMSVSSCGSSVSALWVSSLGLCVYLWVCAGGDGGGPLVLYHDPRATLFVLEDRKRNPHGCGPDSGPRESTRRVECLVSPQNWSPLLPSEPPPAPLPPSAPGPVPSFFSLLPFSSSLPHPYLLSLAILSLLPLPHLSWFLSPLVSLPGAKGCRYLAVICCPATPGIWFLASGYGEGSSSPLYLSHSER